MVKKKVMKIIFSLILCGSLIFLTACQSKEDQRKSKIDQETTRVAKEIDEKLKVKGYTSENISGALLDIYYPQDLFPRVNATTIPLPKLDNYRLLYNTGVEFNFCKGIPEGNKEIINNCKESAEYVLSTKKENDKFVRLNIVVMDFTKYQTYEEWKNLKTERFLDKKYAYLETNNKSKFILVSENSGHIKTQTKTDSASQKIENLIPGTAKADRYEFMYTVFTKLNIPEN